MKDVYSRKSKSDCLGLPSGWSEAQDLVRARQHRGFLGWGGLTLTRSYINKVISVLLWEFSQNC